MIANFCANKIRSGKFPSGSLSKNLFSPRSVSIFPLIIAAKAGFVYINTFFNRNIPEFFLVRLYFLRVLFFVMKRFFLRVIPKRFSALLTA